MLWARQRRSGRGWIFGLVTSFAFGLLIFADAALLRDVERPLAPPSTPPANWETEFPARIAQVNDALAHLPFLLPTPTEAPQGAGTLRWVHRRYELTVPPPEGPDRVEHLLDPVRKTVPGVTLHVSHDAGSAQIQVGIDGLLTHTLTLHWLAHRPRTAIIIDDLGNDLRTARVLVGIEPPLTFAIMPFRPFSKEVAELAKLFGREVLLHLPMEAESGEEFGAREVLRVEYSRKDILRELDDSLAAVPYAVGANNHMGSRFTNDRERMRWVLEHLREKGLFFVDSATTPHSVACEVAATIPIACSTRTIFLDDTDDEQGIRDQLDALLKTAHTHDDTIAIGHPRPATLAALQSAVPGFAAAGVDIVPVSSIITDQFATPRVAAQR